MEIPFTRMGNVTSDDLFEEREQPIFDFYERNRARYSRALDIGANVGVHAILMARQGWEVMAIEPDPRHFDELLANLERNQVRHKVSPCRAAVSTRRGKADFVRVLGNTTANHLAGARECYGPTESIRVNTLDCRALFDWADFAKIDVEGHEAELLLTVTPAQARRIDFMVEVGSPANAKEIYTHFMYWAPMWSQKIGWAQVERLRDMPAHYTDGSLFIGEWR